MIRRIINVFSLLLISATLFPLSVFKFKLIENPMEITYPLLRAYQNNQDKFHYMLFISISILIISMILSKKFKYPKIRKAKRKSLNHLSWREFEQLTQEYYKKKGFKSKIVGGSGGDGGIDVIIKRGDKTWIVQCKHWKTTKVGVKIARELFGVMIHEKVYGVKIISTSGFTKEAYQFSKGKNIELIDGKKLMSDI